MTDHAHHSLVATFSYRSGEKVDQVIVRHSPAQQFPYDDQLTKHT